MGVIQRQAIKNFFTTYLGIAIGFVSLIWIQPNFLSKEQLGLTRLIYSFSMLVAMFVPLGIGNATTKYFPLFKNAEKGHYGYLVFMLLFPLLGFSVAALGLYLFKDFVFAQYANESPLFIDFYFYVFPLTLILALTSCLNVYCYANYKSTIPAFLNDVVSRLLIIAVVTAFYFKWLTLHQLIACYVGVYALQMVAVMVYIFVFDTLTFRIDRTYFKEKNFLKLINYGLLLWFAGVASIGLKYFDSIMIGKYMPLAFVGVYTIAAFIPTVIEAPLTAIEKIAAAKISFAWAENNRVEILEIYKKSTLYMLLLGGLLFLGINVNIKTLLSFLPQGYEAGAPVVLILSVGTLFNMATGLNAPILFNSDKYRYGAWMLIALAALSLVLQMLFIPRMGIIGAACATAASYMFYNCVLFWFVYKYFNLQPFDKTNVYVLLLIILLFMLHYIMPQLSNPFLDILYKSFSITLLYIVVLIKMQFVPEFNRHIPSYIRKLLNIKM